MEEGTGIQTLKLVNEIKIHKLLSKIEDECENDRKLEASGVVYHDNSCYVVFDNLSRIARIGSDLEKGAWCLLGNKDGAQGYEGITYNEHEGEFYIVVEMAKSGKDGSYYAWVHAYQDEFSSVSKARLDHKFSKEKKGDKGFEGLAFVYRGGCGYLLALCEGNRCLGGKKGKKRGGGRIQVFERDGDGWAHSGRIRIPETVRFKDYSGLDIRNRKVAVVSQEESKLWISTLGDDWTLEEGTIYRFPRTKKGKKKYCRVEGVSWTTDTQIVVVSDSRKGDPARCKKRQRSIHIFNIPS